MIKRVTDFSGRRGASLRRATATLLAAVLAAAAGVAATATPAAAWGDRYAATVQLMPRTVKELTDGRNYIVALGRAEERSYAGHVLLAFPARSAGRESHLGALDLAGGVAYTGAGPDVTWTRLRINFATHRISARVDGGDRVAVLRVDDRWNYRDTWGAVGPRLTLTAAGARSLNRAADGAPFSAGDVFADDSSGCSH